MAKNLTHKGNHCTLWIHPLTVWQEVPKSDFQMSKIIRIFLFFFQLKIIVKEQNFCTSQLQDFIRKTLPGAYTIRPSSKAGLNFSDLYRISSYSFRGNYSFLSLEIQRSKYIRQKVTVHKCVETIQGRKLFKGGNYMKK
jgi:hypothetical protein